jgi:hypothetical protein
MENESWQNGFHHGRSGEGSWPAERPAMFSVNAVSVAIDAEESSILSQRMCGGETAQGPIRMRSGSPDPICQHFLLDNRVRLGRAPVHETKSFSFGQPKSRNVGRRENPPLEPANQGENPTKFAAHSSTDISDDTGHLN